MWAVERLKTYIKIGKFTLHMNHIALKILKDKRKVLGCLAIGPGNKSVKSMKICFFYENLTNLLVA